MVVKLVLDSLKMVPQQIHFEDILSLHNFSVHFVSKLNYGHFFQIFFGILEDLLVFTISPEKDCISC